MSPLSFKGYRGEGEWLYRNPFYHVLLTDDEIAVAHCMEKMGDFVKTGKSFYSLSEASQDAYLVILFDQASRENRTLES